MTQNRWKSPVVWGAVVAQVLALLTVLDVINLTQSDAVNGVVAAVLQALVAFGVLNNPTDKTGF
jgi:uncharacterized membrane protein